MSRLLCCALVLAAACSSEDGFEPVVDLPDPPEKGIQLVFKQVTLMPGEDLEFCTYFNLETEETLLANGARAFDNDLNVLDSPFLLEQLNVNGVDMNKEIAINKVEIVTSPGLHHVQLLALENDTWDYPGRHIFECGIDLFGGPLTGDVEPLFFTSISNFSNEYAPGTARILKRTTDIEDDTKTRGTQLLYNFHYLNTTDQPLIAEVVVNLHTVDRASVVHPIRSAWWNYVYFEATADGESQVDAHGSFKVDVQLVGMTSHQHEFGKRFTFARNGEQIYENIGWAEPEYLTFPETTVLPAGEKLDFHCEWDNPTSESRYFGLQADDEMCTAIVEYHPVDEAAADALLEQLRMEAEQNPSNNPFGGDAVSLENFLPMPEELVEQVAAMPDKALEILDQNIICGFTRNFKEMEEQYGRSPDNLTSLQMMVDLLAELCGIE